MCWLALFAAQAIAQDAGALTQDDPVLEYLRAIETAESERGAYASELVDLYYGMGALLLEMDDLPGARDAFHRTVMVVRVNSGPNSLDQTNYLYSIAEIESRLGNPQTALSVLENIYRLHAAHYGEENAEMLPAVQQIHDWYLDKRPLQGEGVRSADFENLTFLADRIAVLTEANLGLGAVETALRYRALGQLHFRAIHHILRSGMPINPELVFGLAGTEAELIQRAIPKHFSGGEWAFQRAMEAWQENPDSTDLQRAEAIAQLGDWYLAVKDFRRGHRQYEQAWHLLAQSPEAENLAERYLSSPSPLRFLATTEPFVRAFDPPPGPRLEISMSVTRNGLLADIEFLNLPPEAPDEQLDIIRYRLENTRFRPAILNGEAERVENYVWQLPLSTAPPAETTDGSESGSE